MSIELQRRRVYLFRLLIWILMGVVVLLQTEVIPALAPPSSELPRTVLQYLFILLWVLQGLGLWWAQKLGKLQVDSISGRKS